MATLTGTPAENGFTFPPEWHRHSATWISWPKREGGASFPGRYDECVQNIAGVIEAITRFEPVHLNVSNETEVKAYLLAGNVPLERIVFHQIPTDECWTRDHGPAFVLRTRGGRPEAAIVDWGYNAWGGKYTNLDYGADTAVPSLVAKELGLPVFNPGIIMEGGAVDFSGEGTVLTTTSCLLNENRNHALSQTDIERYLLDFYGQQQVVWLGDGIEGDDTDGHIDDLARFINARTIAIGIEQDSSDANFAALRENRRQLAHARDVSGRPFDILELPMPEPVSHDGQRLPATYMNFYFVNGALLVPVFGQPARDAKALELLQQSLPDRRVVGVDCRALIWGLGAIHCLTQQQPIF